MLYDLEIRPSALRDLRKLSKDVARRVLAKIESLRDDLRGDVKRLKGTDPGYRLRVGDYRVLFDLEGRKVVVRRVRHRREAYDRS
ncbi:MAG: type II toxin-antitoxin system RelE/ParE family toxin [Planctomycetota bacterium]|jgi:mRNA interferase RelE/StbE